MCVITPNKKRYGYRPKKIQESFTLNPIFREIGQFPRYYKNASYIVSCTSY